nr:uncharacterized protein LOC123764419 isoform X1 [Procambarus clarkii]
MDMKYIRAWSGDGWACVRVRGVLTRASVGAQCVVQIPVANSPSAITLPLISSNTNLPQSLSTINSVANLIPDCAFRLGIFFSGPSETQSRESNKQQAAHPNRGSNYTQKHSFSKDTLLIKKMSDDPPPYSKSPFPYSKLVEESAPPEDELCMMPPSQPPSATEFHHHHHHHHEQPPPPPQNYLPTPQQDSYPQQPSAPVINVFQQPQPAVGLVVATAGVPPGICTVCRIGKIKNTASFWSWVCCICCLPFGIIPGIIAFYYVNRKPKCNNCGFTI